MKVTFKDNRKSIHLKTVPNGTIVNSKEFKDIFLMVDNAYSENKVFVFFLNSKESGELGNENTLFFTDCHPPETVEIVCHGEFLEKEVER